MTADKGVSSSSNYNSNSNNNRQAGRAKRTHQLIVNCAYFRTAVSFVPWSHKKIETNGIKTDTQESSVLDCAIPDVKRNFSA